MACGGVKTLEPQMKAALRLTLVATVSIMELSAILATSVIGGLILRTMSGMHGAGSCITITHISAN